MNINNVTIAGNLCAAPEIRFLQTGKAVCTLRLANNLKLKSGESKTTFLDCTCWERTAEVAAEFLAKGSPVLLEGRLDQEEWTDRQTGAKRSKHVLTVNRLHLFPQARPGELAGPTPAPAGGEIGFGDPGPAPSAPSTGGDNPFA